MIPFPEVVALADAYLAEVGEGDDSDMRPTLRDTGPVFVSRHAAQRFAEREAIFARSSYADKIEEARRELTLLVLDAKESQREPGVWRARKRSTDLDICVRVAREEDGLLVVKDVISARRYDHRRGGQRGRRSDQPSPMRSDAEGARDYTGRRAAPHRAAPTSRE